MQLAAIEPLLAPSSLRPVAEDALRALGKARFATVSSLMAYVGPSGLRPEMIQLWIQAGLLHQGRVSTDPVTGDSVEYVALSSRGACELEKSGATKIEPVTATRMKRSSQKRLHDLGVGDFALALLALARDGHVDLVGIETDEKRFSTSIVLDEPGKAPSRVPLRADAYAITRGRRGPVGLLVEVDRGTVSVARMRDRYQGYLAWKRNRGPESDFGLRAMRVLTVAPDERRLERLHDAALESNRGRRSGFLLFALAEHATPASAERLLDPVCRPLGGKAEPTPLFER